MAAPRRDNFGCLLIFCALLAAAEYGVITYLVLPLPSTRLDWAVAVLIIAPIAATTTAGLGALTIRVIADILALIRYLGRMITGGQR